MSYKLFRRSLLILALVLAFVAGVVVDRAFGQSRPVSHRVLTGMLIASVAGQSADAATTVWGVRHGGYEANPVFGNRPTLVLGAKAVFTAAAIPLIWRLRDTHPKWAIGLSLAVAGSGAALAAHNVHAVR